MSARKIRGSVHVSYDGARSSFLPTQKSSKAAPSVPAEHLTNIISDNKDSSDDGIKTSS